MANPEMTSAIQRGMGFFTPGIRLESIAKQTQSPSQWVYLGTGISTSFLAVAASLLDKMALGEKLNKGVLKILLKKHHELFPEQMALNGTVLTVDDSIMFLTEKVKTRHFIQSMAQTLSSLTEDALNKSPAAHAMYLISNQKFIEAVKFRLAIVAELLHIQINLLEQTDEKNIPKITSFGEGGRITMTMLVHEHAIWPQIKKHQLVSRMTKALVQDEKIFDLHLSDSTKLIMHATLEDIVSDYEREKHALHAMVRADDLNNSQLMELYSNMLTMSIDEKGSYFVGVSGNLRALYQAITKTQSNPPVVEDRAFDTNALYIEYISSMVSLKTADIERAFEALGSKIISSPSPGI